MLGVEVFHDGAAWCPAGHDASGQVEPGGAGAVPSGGRVAAVVGAHHEVSEVVVRERAGGEVLRGGAGVQSIDAVHSPLVVGEVVGPCRLGSNTRAGGRSEQGVASPQRPITGRSQLGEFGVNVDVDRAEEVGTSLLVEA